MVATFPELFRVGENLDQSRLYVREYPAPAVGEDWSIVVPGHEVWWVLSIRAAITAHNTGDPQVPDLHITNGNVDVAVITFQESADGFVLSRWNYVAYAYQPNNNADVNAFFGPLPSWYYYPGYAFTMETRGFGPTDQWGPQTVMFYNLARRPGE